MVTGNGEFDPSRDDYGDCVLLLAPEEIGSGFRADAANSFTPSNYRELGIADLDLGGSSPVVLPEQTGSATPHLLLTGGKDGVVYLVDRDRMGGIGAEVDRVSLNVDYVTSSPFGGTQGTFPSTIRTAPACWIDATGGLRIYVTAQPPVAAIGAVGAMRGVAALHVGKDPAAGASRLIVDWTNEPEGGLDTGPMVLPGAPTVSSDRPKDGILWVVDTNRGDQYTDRGEVGVLYAYDAVTGHELYDSNQAPVPRAGPRSPARDFLGETRKFATPTVANGRVFVAAGGLRATSTGIAAYGLLPALGI